jgi:hypothetical protein
MESVFVFGIFLGGVIAVTLLNNPDPVKVNPKLAEELSGYGITDYGNMVPAEIFNWSALLSIRGFIMMIVGGF